MWPWPETQESQGDGFSPREAQQQRSKPQQEDTGDGIKLASEFCMQIFHLFLKNIVNQEKSLSGSWTHLTPCPGLCEAADNGEVEEFTTHMINKNKCLEKELSVH